MREDLASGKARKQKSLCFSLHLLLTIRRLQQLSLEREVEYLINFLSKKGSLLTKDLFLCTIACICKIR